MLAIEQSLGVWIPQVQGLYINEDWEPQYQGYGAQCWDLAANWSKYLGLPVINTGGNGRWPGWAGNMVDAFPQTDTIAAAYELIGPAEAGQPGDIAVWGDSYYWYPKTHVAVLIQDKGTQLLCMSQNSVPTQAGNPYPQWTTGPTTIQHLPKAGLIGYIRPRAGISTQGTITEDDMPSAAEVVDELLNREITGDDGKPVRILWILKSFHGIMNAQAQNTAKAVLTTPIPNVKTGGETTLATEIGWLPANVANLAAGAAAGTGDFDQTAFEAKLAESLHKFTDGLSITLTADGGK